LIPFKLPDNEKDSKEKKDFKRKNKKQFGKSMHAKPPSIIIDQKTDENFDANLKNVFEVSSQQFVNETEGLDSLVNQGESEVKENSTKVNGQQNNLPNNQNSSQDTSNESTSQPNEPDGQTNKPELPKNKSGNLKNKYKKDKKYRKNSNSMDIGIYLII
jgi:hypothetical protein